MKELGVQHRVMMMLAIAYAANIGGTGTLIGTPPNLVMFEFIAKFTGQPISFGSWMVFCVPLMVINLVLAWLWLQLLYLPVSLRSNRVRDAERLEAETEAPGLKGPDHEGETVDKKEEKEATKTSMDVTSLLKTRYAELGPMSRHEYSVLFLFILLVVLWLTRSPGFVSGWADVLPPGCGDATPAVFVSLLMFTIPTGTGGTPLLNWDLVQDRLAWGVIILLGGGFALAEGAERSCLTVWAGEQLIRLGGLPAQLLRKKLILRGKVNKS